MSKKTLTFNPNPNTTFYQDKLENYGINVMPDKNRSCDRFAVNLSPLFRNAATPKVCYYTNLDWTLLFQPKNCQLLEHNKLPDDVVSAAPISSFNNKLDIRMDRYGH